MQPNNHMPISLFRSTKKNETMVARPINGTAQLSSVQLCLHEETIKIKSITLAFQISELPLTAHQYFPRGDPGH